MVPFKYILIISLLIIHVTSTQEANAMRNFLEFSASEPNLKKVEEIIQKIETDYLVSSFDPIDKFEALYQEHGAAGLLLAEWKLRIDQMQIIRLIKILEETREHLNFQSNDIVLNDETKRLTIKIFDLQGILESKFSEIPALLSQYSDQ